MLASRKQTEGTCTKVNIYLHRHICTYLLTKIHTPVYICVCTHIYTHINIYYVCLHILIYTHGYGFIKKIYPSAIVVAH